MSAGFAAAARHAFHDDLTSGEDSPTCLLPQTGSATFETDKLQSGEQPAGLTPLQRLKASPWFPHGILLCCQLAFASMHVTSHAALNHIPPTVYSAFRIGMAVPLLLVSARVQEPEFQLHWSDAPWFGVLGVLGVATPQCLVFVGNKLAGAAYVGIFTPTVPVYVALMSALLRIERFTLLKGIGICLSIAGAFVLVHIEKLDLHKANTLGMLALITLNACYSVYLVSLQRYLSRRPYPFSFFAGASLCGCAAVSAVAAREFAAVRWKEVPLSAWGALAWAGWGTSFLAHSGVSWAVGRCSAVIPSIYSCLQPVLTVGLAAAVLGQTLSVRDAGAMGLVLLGVLFVIYSRVSEDARRRSEAAAAYELAGQDGGPLSKGGAESPGRALQRVPSHWGVPDFCSTVHIIAKAAHGSRSRNLEARVRASSTDSGGKSRSAAAAPPGGDWTAGEHPLNVEAGVEIGRACGGGGAGEGQPLQGSGLRSFFNTLLGRGSQWRDEVEAAGRRRRGIAARDTEDERLLAAS